MSSSDPEAIPYEEWFCSSCHTFLLRVVPVPGLYLSIRCRRCGQIIERRIPSPPHQDGKADELKHLLHKIDDKLSVLTQRR